MQTGRSPMRPGRRSRLLAWIRLATRDENALREPRPVVRSWARAGYKPLLSQPFLYRRWLAKAPESSHPP